MHEEDKQKLKEYGKSYFNVKKWHYKKIFLLYIV